MAGWRRRCLVLRTAWTKSDSTLYRGGRKEEPAKLDPLACRGLGLRERPAVPSFRLAQFFGPAGRRFGWSGWRGLFRGQACQGTAETCPGPCVASACGEGEARQFWTCIERTEASLPLPMQAGRQGFLTGFEASYPERRRRCVALRWVKRPECAPMKTFCSGWLTPWRSIPASTPQSRTQAWR